MVSLSNHVASSLRLSTRRGTIIATATRLPPPYQVRGRKTGGVGALRNDSRLVWFYKAGTRERFYVAAVRQ